MTIQQCIYAIEIAKTGSFSRAAKQLFIAQSSLSSSIKSLESELNITIFERSKNGVFLTGEGAEFIRYAEQIVEQNEFILNRYSTPADRKKLYVSTQHYDFVADVFCRLLRETSEENFDFSIREIQTYEVIHEVETAYSDIGIIAIKDSDFDIMSRYLSKKGLNFTQFLKVPPHVFIRRGHPLSEKDTLTYEALRGFPYVSYEQGSHNTSFFTEELADGLTPEKHVKISDRATLMNVLLTTDCYTVGTGIIPSALNDGKIVCIPMPSDSFYRIGYILRNDRNTSPLTKKLINLLCDFSAQYSK
ncbi:MAG: LysR family transcriptional regulator [Clostridia bacterium]|nr:LysR family transcriptional regulator [Clostridia bacterium]